MTGLFHRLAQRVVGPAPPRAHSLSRLPFAPPPGDAPLAPDPAFSDLITAARPSIDREAARRADSDAAPQVARRPETNATATLLVADRPAPFGQDIHAPEADAVAQPLLQGGDFTPSKPIARPESNRVPENDATPSFAPQQRSAAPLRETIHAILPQPLLPEPSPQPPFAPASPRPETATPAPEVHVHIGRIEVTSVADPTPRREAVPRRAPSLSLEDYLAKRRGGP